MFDDRWYTKPALLFLPKGHYCCNPWLIFQGDQVDLNLPRGASELNLLWKINPHNTIYVWFPKSWGYPQIIYLIGLSMKQTIQFRLGFPWNKSSISRPFNTHMLHGAGIFTNICPCPKSPSHVGLHIPAPWFAIEMDGCHGKFQSELDGLGHAKAEKREWSLWIQTLPEKILI